MIGLIKTENENGKFKILISSFKFQSASFKFKNEINILKNSRVFKSLENTRLQIHIFEIRN